MLLVETLLVLRARVSVDRIDLLIHRWHDRPGYMVNSYARAEVERKTATLLRLKLQEQEDKAYNTTVVDTRYSPYIYPPLRARWDATSAR